MFFRALCFLYFAAVPAGASPLQVSVGASAAADVDSELGWRFAPGLRSDLSWGRLTTEQFGWGVALRVDAPALEHFRVGAGPEVIVPVGAGLLLVPQLGALADIDGVGGYARFSLAAKSPNQHGSYGMHSGVFVEGSTQSTSFRAGAISLGVELDLEILSLPVLAAVRPFGGH